MKKHRAVCGLYILVSLEAATFRPSFSPYGFVTGRDVPVVLNPCLCGLYLKTTPTYNGLLNLTIKKY